MRAFCQNSFFVKYRNIIVTVMHFLLTFLWQNIIFLGMGNWEYWSLFERQESANSVSSSFELRLVYILSRIFCFIIIWMFWKVCFYVFAKKVSKQDCIVLGTIFIAGLICVIIMYPTAFGMSIDNYTNYIMARRFQPNYWQSIYTGALYAGCFMVIPHPIALGIIQWFFFWAVISYIYIGFGKLEAKKYKKYVLLILLVPESYYLIFDAYRNNYYTILILFYIFYIYSNIKNINIEMSMAEVLCFSLLSAFIMVWRSEGLIIGISGMILVMLFKGVAWWKDNKKNKVLILTVCMAISFMILNNFQSIGNEKYYGRDYMILNTTNVLSSIFNNPNAYLSYDGADNDLKAIESVVPVEILKEYGMEGFRNYNWTLGREEFNQTLASDDQADAYMSAYYRIIFNNMETYLDVQLNSFYNALQIPATRNVWTYNGDTWIELDGYKYDIWTVGYNEVRSTSLTTRWENNLIRMRVCSLINLINSAWRDIIVNSGLNGMVHVIAIIVVVMLLLNEVVAILDKRRESNSFSICFIVAFGTVLAEFVAILLFMPEGRVTYLYPMLYASYFLIFIYTIESNIKKKNDVKKES